MNFGGIQKALLLCGALSMAACANVNSISRTKTNYGNGQIHFTDAKQRAILSQRYAQYSGDGKERYWFYRYCSEPPPDTFSVLGIAAAAALDTKVEPGKDKITLGLKGALSIAETGSTIERTQTINLLRESMFRTCERFLNGALNETQFVAQAARDQRAMVAILAIEQLTGVVRPQPTVLFAGGNASIQEDLKDIIKELETARKEAEAARIATGMREEELAALEAKACPAQSPPPPTPAPADGGEQAIVPADQELAGEQVVTDERQSGDDASTVQVTTTPAQTSSDCASEDDVKAATEKVASARQTQEEKDTYYKALMALAQQNGAGGLQTSTLGGALQGSAVKATPSDAAREKIASTVQEIVKLTFKDESELVFVCTSYLSAPSARQDNDTLYDACTDMIQGKVALDVAENKKQAAKLEKEAREIINIGYCEDEAGLALETAIAKENPNRLQNDANLIMWLVKNRLPSDSASKIEFLASCKFAALRRLAVNELNF